MSDLAGLHAGADPEGGRAADAWVPVFPESWTRARALVDFLYPTPARRTVPGILAWWEKRRLPYNLMVGAAGTISLGVAIFFSAIPPLGAVPGIGLVFPVAVFGGMANVCYCLGPTLEILVHELWGREVLPVGPALYRMGLTFSVGLALLPALLMIIVWIVRLVSVVL